MSEEFDRNTEHEDGSSQEPPEPRDFQEPRQDYGQRPVPPVGWKPAGMQNAEPPRSSSNQQRQVRIGSVVFAIGDADAVEFQNARNYNIAAQIVALVSLIIGGVFASSAALVLAIISYRKFTGIAGRIQNEDARRALKRAGAMAIIMSCVALALNVVSLIVLMPLVMQIAQTGDYSSLFGGAFGGSSSTNTTWG